jgi:hypothetical protein
VACLEEIAYEKGDLTKSALKLAEESLKNRLWTIYQKKGSIMEIIQTKIKDGSSVLQPKFFGDERYFMESTKKIT